MYDEDYDYRFYYTYLGFRMRLKRRHRKEIPCILLGFRLVEDFALLLIATCFSHTN